VVRLGIGWQRAGEELTTRVGVAGARLAVGWRLAGSRHFPAMNWLGGLGWLVAFRPRGGWDAAGG